MKLDSTAGNHCALDLVMGTIQGAVICLCIFFLAISWPDGTLGSSVEPLFNRHFVSDESSKSNCNLNEESSSRISLLSGANSVVHHRQQLLNQAATLLKQLPSPVPQKTGRELLKNFVQRHKASRNNSVPPTDPAVTSSAISVANYDKITAQYLQVRLQIVNLLSQKDAEIVQSALDALYRTFVKIVTRQLRNAELPNLCTVTLALDTQLNATAVPTKIHNKIRDFMTLLTLALTGQSQITIVGLCTCLNDLETSIVTVIEHDKSQILQQLLSNLVNAVTNVVTPGGNVDCDVIDVVHRYVASIKKAVQEEASVRAGNIYTSVLKFEEQLYKILSAPGSKEITPPSSNHRTTPLKPGTAQYYITEIRRLSKLIFGHRRKLVISTLKTLLNIKKSDGPQDHSTSLHPTGITLEILENIFDFLNSINPIPHSDLTQVIAAIAQRLRAYPQADVLKVLDTLDPNSTHNKDDADTFEDATDIVGDERLFIVRGQLKEQIDDDGNVTEIVQYGHYSLVDPKTNMLYSGNYALQDGTIKIVRSGNIEARGSGVYDVSLPNNDCGTTGATKVRRQANFVIVDEVLLTDNDSKNVVVSETGIFNLTDSIAKTYKSGNFLVENSVAKTDSDGTTVVVKSGWLYADEPGTKSHTQQPLSDDDSLFFLFNDHISDSSDSEGKAGTGIFNINNPKTGESQSGSYVIQNRISTTNADGSKYSITNGFFDTNNVQHKFISNDPDRDLNIVAGAQFECFDYEDYVLDGDENVIPDIIGIFIITEPETGKTTIASFVVQNILFTDNPDGSTDVSKFGKFLDIVVSTDSPTGYKSSSEHNKPAMHGAAKYVPFTKTSYQALINSLSPVKPSPHKSNSVKPHPLPTNGRPQPYDHHQASSTNDNDDSSPGSDYQNRTRAYYNATSIVTDGSSFIIEELVTTLKDLEGNVISEVIMGTYHLMDISTNMSWSGTFEVETTSIAKKFSNNTKRISSGTFNVANPPYDDYSPTIKGKFKIVERLKNGISEGGTTFYLSDPITGDFKTGTVVMKNTISRPKPGDAVENVKAGLLFVGESDAMHSFLKEETPISGYEGFFLCDEFFYDVPDTDGNVGIEVLNIEDPETKIYTSTTYSILKKSITTNADETLEEKIEATILANDDSTGSSTSRPEITNKVMLTVDNHLVFATDTFNHVSLIGSGNFVRTDPETQKTQYASSVILNIMNIENIDGSTITRIFGVFRNDENSDSLSTTQAPSTTDQPEPYILDAKILNILKNGPSPIGLPVQGSTTIQPDPKLNSQNSPSPGNCQLLTNVEDVSRTTKTSQIQDAIEIPFDGASIIISQRIISRADGEGHDKAELSQGTYSIRAFTGNLAWSGTFDVHNFSLTSTTEGQINVMASGSFAVILPNNTSSRPGASETQANFSITGHVSVIVNTTGTLNITEKGRYSMTYPGTHHSTIGDYVILSSISKTNPGGSIDIVKFGVLYPLELCASSSREDVRPIKCGGYFLTDKHVLPYPDVNGHYGAGLYTIADPQSNEFTSGMYNIDNASTVDNSDGTTTAVVSGNIYVDSARSSLISAESYPTLTIINGAAYTFTDHLSHASDANGNTIVSGTGVFTQTDPETNLTRSGKYNILDIITIYNPDGSMDQIEAGTFQYTSDNGCSDDSPGKPTKPSDDSTRLQILNTKLGMALKELSKTLRTLPVSRGASETPGDVPVATQSGSTSITSALPHTSISSETITIPRWGVVAALNGQCIGSGDVIVIKSETGAILLATIQDYFSPVTFLSSSPGELIRKVQTGQKIVFVKTDDFPKRFRGMMEAILERSSAPCST